MEDSKEIKDLFITTSKSKEEVKEHVAVAKNELAVGGVFTITCTDKDGNVKWVDKFHNLVPTEGLTWMAQTLVGVSIFSGWYVGLFTNSITPASTDTIATFATYAGEFTGYSGGTRPLYNKTPPTGAAISNASNKAVFNITVAGVIAGAMIVTNSTISGTTGALIADNVLQTTKTVSVGDNILVQYDFAFTSS